MINYQRLADGFEKWDGVKWVARNQLRAKTMTAREQFESKLSQNLQQEVFASSQTSETHVATAGVFDGLLQALIDTLMNVAMNCLQNRTTSDVARGLVNPGPLERWAMRQAVSKSEAIPSGQKKACESALKSTLKETSADEMTAVLNEIETAKGWVI